MEFSNQSYTSLAPSQDSVARLYAWLFPAAAVIVVSIVSVVCHQRRMRRLRQRLLSHEGRERSQARGKYNALVENQDAMIDDYSEIAARLADEQRPLTLPEIQALRKKMGLQAAGKRDQFLKGVSRSAASIENLSEKIDGVLDSYPDFVEGIAAEEIEAIIRARIKLHGQFIELACQFLEKVENQLTAGELEQHMRSAEQVLQVVNQ